MPTYTFTVRDDDGGVEDDTGINLVNAESAFGYACDVVHEMMACREKTTRHWQLDVYENGRCCDATTTFAQLHLQNNFAR